MIAGVSTNHYELKVAASNAATVVLRYIWTRRVGVALRSKASEENMRKLLEAQGSIPSCTAPQPQT